MSFLHVANGIYQNPPSVNCDNAWLKDKCIQVHRHTHTNQTHTHLLVLGVAVKSRRNEQKLWLEGPQARKELFCDKRPAFGVCVRVCVRVREASANLTRQL